MKQATAILKGLLESGEVPLVILSALARQFRRLFKIRQLLIADVPETTIQKRLNIWRSGWPRACRQAKAYAMEDTPWVFRRFMETDAGLKGGALPPPALMELLVVDLCVGKEKGLRRFIGRQDLICLDHQA